jgi:ABC-type multidrug transport system fused ATPase/permease subunit
MIFGKYINKYYLKYWYFILGVFVFDILVDIIQLYLPRIAGNLVDVLEDASTAKAFMSGQTNDALSALNLPFYCANFTTTLISVAVIALVIVFGRMGWRFFAAQVAGNIERDLRKDMFSHIQTMSLNYYKDKKVGGLLSYFTEDLQTIKQLLSEGFIFMTDLVVLGTLSFTYMFQISWPLTLCCGAPMILFVVFGGLIGKGESKRYKIASDAFESLSDYTEESLQGFSVVKSFLKEGARLKAFKGLCVDTEKKNDRYLNYSSWLDAGINLFITVMYMILLGLALYAMVEVNPFFLGTMVKGGDLVTYVGYFDALIWPMIAGGILISEISMARGAYTRISTILSAKPDIVDKPDSISHDEIQGEIEASHLWFTYPDGNEPALKDVSLCAWPAEHKEDPQSRFVNERMHANIQKDGTYSVVPRMWGGVTTPNELRAIADAADKYGARMVKVTGGQRLDLFGIKKEDLPSIWADLNAAGMVSGHAYGKALRTVKTCVGSEWCRFGTQDSTGLGILLEQMTWGSWMPHKFKIAVSGCPRNCAEATIKDFGVICVDSGYELLVGGNGGIHLRGTDLLCKVATEEEALEYCGAFIQLYREEARYLDRTAPWIERVGLDYVKAKVVEDEEGRKALYGRFLHAQKHLQKDPWAERAAGKEAHLHQHIAEIRPFAVVGAN